MTKMLSMYLLLVACCGIISAQISPQVGLRTFQAPEYPAVARQARIQGDVHLQVMVDAEGKITSVESTSGAPILAEQAKSNIVQWSFTPPGQPMKLDVVYTFRLEKPEMERAPIPRIRLESPTHVVISSHLPKIVG